MTISSDDEAVRITAMRSAWQALAIEWGLTGGDRRDLLPEGGEFADPMPDDTAARMRMLVEIGYRLRFDTTAELRDWLRRAEAMPFELRDLGLVKLFFADALDARDELALLAAVRARSEQRVADLRAIEPAGIAADDEGNAHPLLTLRMGIAVHQAMADVCEEFERKLARA